MGFQALRACYVLVVDVGAEATRSWLLNRSETLESKRRPNQVVF